MSLIMLHLLLFAFLGFGSPVCFAQSRSLVTVRLDSGEWLAVKEVARSRLYWLYPRPEIWTATWCQSCAQANALNIRIRFWHEDLFENIRLGLQNQGRCAKTDPCRIAPFQATRVVMRDPKRYFQQLPIDFAVQGFLPSFYSFSIVPVAFTNKSSLPLEHLKSLEIDIRGASDRADSKRQQLIVTGLDMELALRLLPGKQNNYKMINQRGLERLTDLLLKMKSKLLDGATALRVSQKKKLQRHLMSSSMEYSDEMKELLPAGYHAKNGEVVYILRQLKPNEQISVSLEEDKNDGVITVGVTIRPELTAAENTDLNDSSATPTNITSLLMLQKQMEKLAKLIKAENLLTPSLMNLRAIDDCFEVKQQKLEGGVFYLLPLQRAVSCTADGYLEVLRRSGDGTDFNVSRAKYESGIGNVESGDYFLGLEALSQLALKDDLCVNLKLFPWRLNVTLRTANYDSFSVSGSKDDYRLSYEGFSGTALTDILSFAKGQAFSTFDRDLDNFVGSCARKFKSGNWYASCQRSNIFGPYLPNAFNGMCSVGMARSQGTICSPLNRVQILLRKKIHVPKSTKIVHSIIASPLKNCTSTLQLFDVTQSGLYKITVGGGPGGLSPRANTRPGGRGAKLTGTFRLEKGSTLALSAGCRGKKSKSYGGHGGSASWVVLRPKGVLLAVAGGGGGAGQYYDLPLDGMHGRATPEGGDAWYHPSITRTYTAQSIIRPTYYSSYYGKGWRDLRQKFLSETSGDVTSGGNPHSCYCGAGGGGFEGGFGPQFDLYSPGGGGGSLCNVTEAAACSVEAGGNMRPDGFIVIERLLCF